MALGTILPQGYVRVCPTFYIWHFNRPMRSCGQP
jgi:hypothetical protein